MSKNQNTRVAAAAAAILAEGTTVATFAEHAASGQAFEVTARQATESAGLSYWVAAREAYALSTSKVAVRTMADAAGVPVADVHALTRLGRVAAVVDGVPSGADCLSMLLAARSRDGQRVGPFDTVAANENVTAENVAATLADAIAKDAAARAKAAKDAAKDATTDEDSDEDTTDEGGTSDGQTTEEPTVTLGSQAASIVAVATAMTARIASGERLTKTERLNLMRAMSTLVDAIKDGDVADALGENDEAAA